MLDKHGMLIGKGFLVESPEPNDSDIFDHAFVGTVKGFHDKYVVVEDQEGDCFDLEPERIKIL